MKNKQYGEAWPYGLVRGESGLGSLCCWKGRWGPASLAAVLGEGFLAMWTNGIKLVLPPSVEKSRVWIDICWESDFLGWWDKKKDGFPQPLRRADSQNGVKMSDLLRHDLSWDVPRLLKMSVVGDLSPFCLLKFSVNFRGSLEKLQNKDHEYLNFYRDHWQNQTQRTSFFCLVSCSWLVFNNWSSVTNIDTSLYAQSWLSRQHTL